MDNNKMLDNKMRMRQEWMNKIYKQSIKTNNNFQINS